MHLPEKKLKAMALRFVGWFVIVLSLSTQPANANEDATSAISVGFINVDWFPFHYGKDNAIKGFAIDVVDAVLDQMRRDVDFRATPFSVGLAGLKSGELDAYFGLAKNLERIEKYRYSKTPLYVDETVLIGRADETFTFDGDVSSLIGNKVGIIKGAIHGAAFDNMNGIIRVPHDSGKKRTEKFFRDVLTDTYRFIAVNARAGSEHYLKKLSLQDKIKIFDEPIAVKTYYLVFSKQMPNLENTVKRFDRIHQLYRSTNEYKALLQKYNLNRKLYPR